MLNFVSAFSVPIEGNLVSSLVCLMCIKLTLETMTYIPDWASVFTDLPVMSLFLGPSQGTVLLSCLLWPAAICGSCLESHNHDSLKSVLPGVRGVSSNLALPGALLTVRLGGGSLERMPWRLGVLIRPAAVCRASPAQCQPWGQYWGGLGQWRLPFIEPLTLSCLYSVL